VAQLLRLIVIDKMPSAVLGGNSSGVDALPVQLEVPFSSGVQSEWMRTLRCEYGFKWNTDYSMCTREVYKPAQKPGVFRKLISPIIKYTKPTAAERIIPISDDCHRILQSGTDNKGKCAAYGQWAINKPKNKFIIYDDK